MSNKLLFVIPSSFYLEEYHKLIFNKIFPIDALQLSSYLKKKHTNIETNFIDIRFENRIKNSFLNNPNNGQFKEELVKLFEKNQIQNFNKIILNLTLSSQYLQADLIANILKKEFNDLKIIVCGYHPTAIPENYLYKKSPYDFLILGEPEETLNKLIKSKKSISSGQNNGPKVLHSEQLVDLNTIPLPDFHTYLKKYPFKNNFNFTISMSRGCPYNCRFCRILKNGGLRNMKFDIFKEKFDKLKEIVLNYNKKKPKIVFNDQCFNSSQISKRVLNLITHDKLHDQFSFSCQTRAELILKYREQFKKAKMRIALGLESASKILLIEMNKTKNPTKYLEIFKEIINFYKKNNEMFCRLNILIGVPGETENTVNETLNFLKNNVSNNNIEIFPSLYSNEPFTNIYQNMKYYESKFGTKFIKEWWKIHSDPIKNSVLLKPSKNYSKKQLIGDFKDKFFPFIKNYEQISKIALIIWKIYYNKWYDELY